MQLVFAQWLGSLQVENSILATEALPIAWGEQPTIWEELVGDEVTLLPHTPAWLLTHL